MIMRMDKNVLRITKTQLVYPGFWEAELILGSSIFTAPVPEAAEGISSSSPTTLSVRFGGQMALLGEAVDGEPVLDSAL